MERQNDSRGLFLKVLLNRAHTNIPTSLLQKLPPEEAEAIARFSITATDPKPLLNHNNNTLSKIHYSWISAYLKSIESKERRSFLSCLDEEQSRGVARLLGDTTPVPVHSLLLKKFYLTRLFSQLPFRKHLPLEYIPSSPFKRLAELSKTNLVEIIDLLSMYDLSQEIRRIVATKNLKNLYTCLSSQQQHFLRLCLNQKDKVVTASLHLEKWNGDCKTLQRTLQQRGISRLAIALSGQHPDLLWHIAHTLDTGRGRLLLKQVKEEEVPRLTTAISLQLENILNYLVKKPEEV